MIRNLDVTPQIVGGEEQHRAQESAQSLPIAPLGPDRTVEQMLVREIRRLIVEGDLEAGTRLPYRTLATQFDVSVTPVRIALRELAKEGLVEILRTGGVRVTPLSIDEIEELFSIRSGLESRLAFLGAPKLQDADLDAMEPLFGDVERMLAEGDRNRYVAASLAYRSHCYRAAERPRLFESVQLLFRSSARYNRAVVGPRERLIESFELMSHFRDACRARNGDDARSAVRALLDRSLEYFVTHPFEAQGDPIADEPEAASVSDD